jgi:rhamnosyltransferase
MPTASVVIRCYNEERHIGRLLHGVTQQTVKDVEIIIVDSGSTDATVSVASRFPTKVISINPNQFSFGRSLNFGCRASKSDFIVAASAHVYPVHTDWLEKLLHPFKDSNLGLVYGKQIGDKLTKYSEHQILSTWFPDNSNYNQSHPFCNNANAAIRKSLWLEIPYDESLTGLEDLDWANRIMQAGYKVAYEAEAEVVHVHDENPSQTYNRYLREAIALKKIFPREHFHFGEFLRLFFSNLFTDYLDASRERVILKHFREIFTFRFMQFWGTYQGFSQRGPISTHLRRTFYYPNQNGKRSQGSMVFQENRPLVDYESGERTFRRIR